MFELRDVNAFYDDSHIIHGVSLQIGASERVALVGRNGVGKSTLLKSIMNAEPRVTGQVLWEGRDITSMPAHRRTGMGFSFVPEDRRILTEVTVADNLRIAQRAARRYRDVDDVEKTIRDFEMLMPLADRPGGRLSGGQQQMLAVARAIITRPRLMLLDEPAEGLAPVITDELARSVIDICERTGAALLLCEQNLAFGRKCTERVMVMNLGQIVYSGTWDEFDADAEIRDRYLTV